MIRWTAAFLRPHRGRVGLILLLSVAEIGLNAAAPWSLTLIVDSVLGSRPLPGWMVTLVPRLADLGAVALLVLLAATGLTLQVAAELARIAHTQVETWVGQRVVHELRNRLLEHLQAMPLTHHLTHRTSDAVYRLDADTYCINDLVTSGAFPIVLAGLHLAVMFVVLLTVDATLAVLALAVGPFLYLCLRYHSTTLLDRAEQVKTLEAGLVERAYETLRSIAAIKSYARERHELDRFSGAGRATMQARVALTWQESLFSLAVTAVTLAGTAAILVVGGLHVLDGTLTVGRLLLVVAYLAAVYDPISAIAHTVGSLQQAVVSARRVRDMLALRPERADADDAVDAGSVTGHVRFEDVDFSYDGSRRVLDGRELRGASRRGRGHRRPDGGGQDHPRAPDTAALRAGVGARRDRRPRRRAATGCAPCASGSPSSPRIRCCSKGPSPTTSATGASTPRTPTDRDEAARAARASTTPSDGLPLGYATPVAEAGKTLSGGERQRLGIARALLKDAPILILDEPTSAVDTIAEAAVFDNLRALRGGRTTFVIAHRLSTIRDATRILVLVDGRISAQGPHEALLASSALYRRMWDRLSRGGSLDEPGLADERTTASMP